MSEAQLNGGVHCKYRSHFFFIDTFEVCASEFIFAIRAFASLVSCCPLLAEGDVPLRDGRDSVGVVGVDSDVHDAGLIPRGNRYTYRT